MNAQYIDEEKSMTISSQILSTFSSLAIFSSIEKSDVLLVDDTYYVRFFDYEKDFVESAYEEIQSLLSQDTIESKAKIEDLLSSTVLTVSTVDEGEMCEVNFAFNLRHLILCDENNDDHSYTVFDDNLEKIKLAFFKLSSV